MPSKTTILAFDTSAAHCAAALLRGTEILASRAEAMQRGQAERLMPLLQEILSDAALAWNDLDAVGVGTGPGNFTGIRISVSAARGLALGLNVPAVGVTGFEALADLAPPACLPAINGPRDYVYVHPENTEPCLANRDEANAFGSLFFCSDPELHVQAIARIAANRWSDVTAPPAPFYIRPADAAPSSHIPPVLLDE
ncbi:tRNA (adenosine(37)-N6)-threonylcarbamoyltransferase complex dimerization subunit type 1 TsaB [Ruegeria arenilitoris]|uniref:tRNA (adenosine(37)-N6)-threonylcarbamoyltransferase complex dimerization subunit type 1 TsaB n=1 Tax=Ruegeria arenilitoris TaxID=1173585 RepID=UPI00147B61BF|nr:tRNA (adenosine(37)-N6)-threonylcarbamoyltransferase complex dimerization subunit type 1 TsaB [Ruegeria arenilitoris]